MPSALDQIKDVRDAMRADLAQEADEKHGYRMTPPSDVQRAREIGEEIGALARGKYLLGLKKHSDQPPLRTQGARKIFYEILMEGLDTCVYALEGIAACEEAEAMGEPFTTEGPASSATSPGQGGNP